MRSRSVADRARSINSRIGFGSVTARQSSCGTVQIVSGFSASDVTSSACSGVPAEAVVGDSISVTVQVSNDNDQAANATVEVTVGGQSFQQSTTVAGNSTSDVPVTVQAPQTEGSYDVNASVVGASQA